MTMEKRGLRLKEVKLLLLLLFQQTCRSFLYRRKQESVSRMLRRVSSKR